MNSHTASVVVTSSSMLWMLNDGLDTCLTVFNFGETFGSFLYVFSFEFSLIFVLVDSSIVFRRPKYLFFS